jgi:myo-inositol-1-phosphate synthase
LTWAEAQNPWTPWTAAETPKRAIKTETVAAALPYKAEVVAGSTDYVDFLQNKRDSYFFISGVYFCKPPLKIDLKFQTVDAPNAGSVLLDVVRAVKVALGKKQAEQSKPSALMALSVHQDCVAANRRSRIR